MGDAAAAVLPVTTIGWQLRRRWDIGRALFHVRIARNSLFIALRSLTPACASRPFVLPPLCVRRYSGRQVVAEYSPVTDFREARCRQFDEQGCVVERR